MKKRINIIKKNKKWNNVILYVVLGIVLFISVGYSSMNTTLNISGKGYFRVSDWIRITSMNISSVSSGGVENYNSKYSKNELMSSISLPNGSSSVTYNFTIENFSDKYGYIKNITNTEYSNSNVKYEISGCNINDTLDPHQVLNCTITFTNISGTNDLSSIILFEFDELISSDANLIDLSVLNYQLAPPFVEDLDEYSVEVEETDITIIATTSSDKATVTGDGVVPVSWGTSRKEVIVTAEDNTVKKYYINVNNIRPIAPVIEIDNDDYVKDKHSVSIKTAGTALSDVDYYEYYISDTNSIPSEDVTVSGTTNGSEDITTDGITYIFYRTVSKHGNRSVWSNGVESKIDTQDPYADVTANDTYPNDVPTITFSPTTIDNESGIDYYQIYYKLSTDNNYQLLNGTSVTGIAGATYDYYVISYDKVGNHAQSETKHITLKNYGQNATCGYTYSNYTSTTTNDVSACTEVPETTDGTTYTTCSLGNWSTTPTTTGTDSCTVVDKTTNGTSYTTCEQYPWTLNSTQTQVYNCDAVAKSDTGKSYRTCTLDSNWTTYKTEDKQKSCSAHTYTQDKVECSKSTYVRSGPTYVTSCSATTVVVCNSGYRQYICPGASPCHTKNTSSCCSGGTYTSYSGGWYQKIEYYWKKVTKVKYYTKKEYSRSYIYNKKVYTRLYNKTVYTRTKNMKTCWY